MMNRLPSLLTAGALAAVAMHVLPAAAQSQPGAAAAVAAASAPGKAAVGSVVTASATVTAIDKATRAVTLKGPQGNEFRVVAGPEVRNFDQIKVGDQLVVTHAEALTLELKKGGGGIRERVESDDAARAKAGDRPGAAGMQTVTVVADVVAVNPRTQTVTLRGPQHTVDLRVPDRKQFQGIKVGDQVQARYTEAVAISMEPPPAKK
jgi:Cu/Ag efflux protein CusF